MKYTRRPDNAAWLVAHFASNGRPLHIDVNEQRVPLRERFRIGQVAEELRIDLERAYHAKELSR